jgi:hypothetical protein
MQTLWIDRAMDIAHDTGFKLTFGQQTGDKPCWVEIKLPDIKPAPRFSGRTFDSACWALCVSEFPDPDDLVVGQ